MLKSAPCFVLIGLLWTSTFPCETGTILREYWTGISGTSVDSLTNNPNYPDNPTGRSWETTFEGPSNWGDNYGARFRGYVHAPITGYYEFLLSGDDNCELWLSSSADPMKKQLIATASDSTLPMLWDKYRAKHLATVYLTAGTKYYIEALHKAGTGSDNITVGWKLPNRTYEQPIPGVRLSPYPAAEYNNGVNFSFYKGRWYSLPDFNSLTPSYGGKCDNFTIVTSDDDNNFAYKFTGYISIYSKGEYTFYTNSSDGSQLLINDQVIVDNDKEHTAVERSGKISLEQGVYPITVEYFQRKGEGVLEVKYQGPGISKQSIPTSVLFTVNPSPINRKTEDMIALYDFSEGRGSTIFDKTDIVPYLDLTASGNGFSWTSDGGFHFSYTQQFMHNFHHSDAILLCNSAGKLFSSCTQTGEFTAEAWIKTDNLFNNNGRGPGRIMSFESGRNSNFILAQDGAAITFYLRTSNNDLITLKSPYPVFNNTSDIYHLIVEYKPYNTGTGGMKIYVNGKKVADNSETGIISSSGNNAWDNNLVLAMGNRPQSLDCDWHGTIYLASIYEKLLTDTEIIENFNAGPFWNSVPRAPSGLITSTNNYSILLSWKDNSRNETGYKIYRSIDSGSVTVIATLLANTTTYTDNVGSCGVICSYSVKAFNNNGESQPAVTTGYTLPCVPQNLTATSKSASEISLSWSGGGLEFVIEGSLSSSTGWQEIYRGTAKVFIHQGLVCNTRWYYRAKALNQAGYSTYTGTVSTKSCYCPINSPSNLTADSTVPDRITLRWMNNSDKTAGFQVFRQESGDSSYQQIVGYIPVNITTYIDSSVSCNTSYSYYVIAFDLYSESGPSNIATATTMYCGAEKATSEMIALCGMVLDSSKNPVNGNKQIIVNVFNKPTGGFDYVYQETFKDMPVINGYFTVALGLTKNITDVIRGNSNLYYDIIIDGKSIYHNTLQPLTASPYTIKNSYNLSGVGAPIGKVIAPIGASYVDTQNRSLYLKAGISNNDWIKVGN